MELGQGKSLKGKDILAGSKEDRWRLAGVWEEPAGAVRRKNQLSAMPLCLPSQVVPSS